MTTKEQERKALEQIRKIVEGLGEDSYVATAFEGCFDKAEENIENDWACSWKQKAESEEKRANEYKDKANELFKTTRTMEKTIIEKQSEIDALRKEMKEEIEKRKKQIAKLMDKVMDERKDIRIKATDCEERYTHFGSLKFVNSDGFKFITVTEPNGFANSYRLDEIEVLDIQ